MVEGKERENHKYVARVKVKRTSGDSKKNQYRYFYSQESYRAYLKNNTDIKKEDVEYFDQKKSTDGKDSSFLDKLKSVGKDIQECIKSGKEAVSKFFDNAITDSGWERVDTKKEEDSNNKFIEDRGWERVDTKKEEDKKSIFDKIFTHETKISTLSQKDSEKETEKDSDKKKQKDESYEDMVKRLKREAGTKEDTKDSKIMTKEDEHHDNKTDREKQLEEITEWLDTIEKAHERFPLLYVKGKQGTDDEDQAAINPNYDKTSPEYSKNCAYCTAAYELRQRGYDVEANPMNGMRRIFDDNTDREITSWYKDPVVQKVSDIEGNEKTVTDRITQDILSQGEGARGQFLMKYRDGSGHSIAYEVTNGEVLLRDCQINKTFKLETGLINISSKVTYFRTDNLELTDKIKKTVRNRK